MQQIDGFQNSVEHNSTSFVFAVNKKLEALFPQRYAGDDGNQNVSRDGRYMEIGTDVKIPKHLGFYKLELIRKRSSPVIREGQKVQDASILVISHPYYKMAAIHAVFVSSDRKTGTSEQLVHAFM